MGPHGRPYGPEVTRHPRTGELSAVSRTSAVARVTRLATASPRRAANIWLGPRARCGVGGEKDTDGCVGEVVQLRCAEGSVVPAEHGLVQWLAQDQPGEVSGCELGLVGLQESSLGEILEAGSQRCQRVPGNPLVVGARQLGKPVGFGDDQAAQLDY